MGPKTTQTVNGKIDTIYHKIPAFEYLNQDSVWVNQQSLDQKIYVADFFFTSCPTICPKMKTQMLRLYERYEKNNDVALVSYSIDPEFDRPNVLKAYAKRLQIKAPKWNLLTGDKKSIYTLGEKSYMVTTQEDPNEAGGFVHSGAFILVDKNKHVRGIYDGTKAEEVDHLIQDMEILLNEK
ncbi:SCO family protein [Aquirufa sp. ROCK2-A2]